jgi:phosphatidyl-myo-inositol dimannoside synthase
LRTGALALGAKLRTAIGGLPARVLLTSSDFHPKLGGIATLAHQLARALDARDDVSVRIIAPSRPGAQRYDRDAEVDIRRISTHGQARNIVQFYRAVREEIRAWSPDAVVNLSWLPDGISTQLATAGTGIPYFVFAHGAEVIESRRTLRKRMRALMSPAKRSVFEHAGRALAVSDFTAGKLRECGVADDRIAVVHGGVDVDEFRPWPKPSALVERYGLAGRPTLLTVCRLYDHKGVDTAIEAVSIVSRTIPDAAFVVCGDGPARGRLEALARSRGLERNVVFTGVVAQEELCDHYNLCDAFVLLSREDLATPNVEGFGLVFLEAAACAKPSIAGRSGGVPDAVGDTAWLVDPGDPRQAAQAMLHALQSPSDRDRRGASARARALASFRWSAMAQRVLDAVLPCAEPSHVVNAPARIAGGGSSRSAVRACPGGSRTLLQRRCDRRPEAEIAACPRVCRRATGGLRGAHRRAAARRGTRTRPTRG